MTGLMGSKRRQAEDQAELLRLMEREDEPITDATRRKLRSLANKAAWRARFAPVDPGEGESA